MATRQDYGSGGDPLNLPSHTAWAAAVATDIDTLTAAVEDSGWIPMTLTSPWRVYDAEFGTPAYRKIGRTVYLGGIAAGGGAAGSEITVLPEGFHPSGKIAIKTLFSQNVYGHLYVYTDGWVTTADVGIGAGDPVGWLLLDSLKFDVL